MGQRPFISFEENLQKSAEQLEIKPSAKVWQSVESNLNSNAIGGATGISSIAKSLLSNWILNIAVPAVVLVGGGSIFYANYHHANNAEATNNTINEANSSVINTDKNSYADAATTVLNNKKATDTKTTSNEAIVNDNSNTVDNNKSQANATNFVLGMGSKNTTSKNNTSSSLLTANKSAASIDSDQFSNASGSVFTPSDIDKIAKKETEKIGKIEYKERNNKSIDFTE
ncbi:MAG: hypothetical protein RJA07_1796 [Bacteroidota bacterium]|jgi:hypothetical protein